MPRLTKKRFTQHTVTKFSCPKGKPYAEIRDAGLRGLSLRARPSGKKSFFVQLDRNTKRVVGDATMLTLNQARKKATEIMAGFQDGKVPDSAKSRPETLKAFLEGQYTDWIIKQAPRYGKRDTLRLVRSLGPLANKRLDQVSQIAVEKWKAGRDVRPATVNRELAQLKAALNRAVEWTLIPFNPAKSVRRLKDTAGKRVRYLSKEERKRLEKSLSQRNDHLSAIVRLVLNTGLRRGEVFALCWEDVNLQAKRLTIHARNAKSGKDRHVPLNKQAVKILKAWRIRSGVRKGLVFPNPTTGTQRTEIKTAWRTLMQAAEIQNFRFHDLRHDFASRLVMAGVDLYHVKELLGHGSIEITQRYAHLAPHTLAEAVDTLA